MSPDLSPDPATRRDFLKTSAAAAAATAFAGGAFAAGTDVLRIGLIGCGGRGTGAAAQALNADPNVKLVAMCDAFDDRLQGSLRALKRDAKIAGKIDVTPERCFTDFDGYRKLIECGVDVVLLCTPPGFRPLHLRAAIDAGKHVFCEKPVAVDAPGVRSVIETAQLARKKNLALLTGYCYRYDLAKRETVKRIHAGEIGDVLAIHANYLTGSIWFRGNDPKWSEMEYQMRNWYYFTWLSGDFNVEQHCHNLDKAAWVMQGKTPVNAVGLGGRQVRTDPKYGNIYDHFSVVYEYANGSKLFSYCRQMPGCINDVSDTIMGTKGICRLMEHAIVGSKPWNYEGPEPNMYQVEHDELFASIRGGRPINDGESAAHSTLMAVMGRMAAYTGKRVTWQQALNSKEDLSPAKYVWGPNPVPAVAIPGVTKLV